MPVLTSWHIFEPLKTYVCGQEQQEHHWLSLGSQLHLQESLSKHQLQALDQEVLWSSAKSHLTLPQSRVFLLDCKAWPSWQSSLNVEIQCSLRLLLQLCWTLHQVLDLCCTWLQEAEESQWQHTQLLLQVLKVWSTAFKTHKLGLQVLSHFSPRLCLLQTRSQARHSHQLAWALQISKQLPCSSHYPAPNRGISNKMASFQILSQISLLWEVDYSFTRGWT